MTKIAKQLQAAEKFVPHLQVFPFIGKHMQNFLNVFLKREFAKGVDEISSPHEFHTTIRGHSKAI